MINNKTKENIIKSYSINSQKIKNLIHLNDLKKLKKYSIVTYSNNYEYILQQTKLILKKLAHKYNRGPEFYYKKVISDIIDNEPSHLVASFKEYLIFGDYSEFLQGYFNLSEVFKFLPLIFDYYHSSTVIFPNYVTLEEKKYIYKNIKKKQQIINIQQEQEELDEKIKKKKIEKKKTKNNNDIISYESDNTSESDVLTPHVLNSILNQTNTSNNIKLFGVNTTNNTSKELIDFIEKLKNEEKKICLKNKNQKNKNKHMIAIHKGNNLKKDNNKSNNTNTCNTISTKNNTKGKEKSNIDGKSFSDKNIKKNYNLSSINLDYSKNINKHFLLKLNQIKRKNEEKTAKNILSELSCLNTSKKLKKINVFSKKSKIITEYNKISKKSKEKESIQIQNYNHKHIKRIQSCYGMNQNNSRNKKIFCESSLFSKDSNISNRNISKNCTLSFKICSTLNNIYKNDTLLSIDKSKKVKKIIPKKNNIKLDSKIINVIYSKRLPSNYSTKNCIKDAKKIFKNKINKNKITIPIEKRTNSNKKSKIKKSKYTSKMINPFEIKISPPNTNRNANKKILKFTLLSPNNINTKFITSRIIPKTLLNKNLQLNNKKIQLKKDIKKLLKENQSNKMIKRTNIIDGKQININHDFMTLNIEKNYKHNPSPIDMKKNLENRKIINSTKVNHRRTKTLCNNLPDFYIKYIK